MHEANFAKKKIRRITQVSSTPPYRNTGTPYHLVDPLLKVSGKKTKNYPLVICSDGQKDQNIKQLPET